MNEMSEKNTVRMIGERIRYYRTMRNLTQEEIAECIGSTGSYVGRIERGEKNVKIETLEKIADALNVNVLLLFQQDTLEPLQDHPWIIKCVSLLLEQPERNQHKAYRILKEIFHND
jgi:transcriptional regulator with XRE-family HTH domain